MAKTTKVKNLHVLKCDISNKSEVEKTVLFIENEIGKIDIAILMLLLILLIKIRILI